MVGCTITIKQGPYILQWSPRMITLSRVQPSSLSHFWGFSFFHFPPPRGLLDRWMIAERGAGDVFSPGDGRLRKMSRRHSLIEVEFDICFRFFCND